MTVMSDNKRMNSGVCVLKSSQKIKFALSFKLMRERQRQINQLASLAGEG